MNTLTCLRHSLAILAVCGAGLLSAPANAQPLEGEIVKVTLISGDVLTGVLVSRVGEGVVLDHPTLGRLNLPQANVREIVAVTDAEEGEAPAEEAEEEPVEEKPKSPWIINLEFGANGSKGNTDKDSVRFSTLATRETDRMKTDLSFIYRYSDEDGDKTENNLFARARNAWKFTDAPRWSMYVEGTYEFDDFQDWTDRMTLFAGVGYRIVEKENETLDGRIGLGGTQRWGSEDDSWDTQLQFAIDYRKQINDRLAFAASAEYLPMVNDLTDARLRGTADLEVKLNEEGNWLMKIGIEDKYDSSPGDADHNDFFYGASIVMVF